MINNRSEPNVGALAPRQVAPMCLGQRGAALRGATDRCEFRNDQTHSAARHRAGAFSRTQFFRVALRSGLGTRARQYAKLQIYFI